MDRTVPAAEGVDEVLGRAIAEVEGPASDLQQEVTLVEVLVQPVFSAPLRRRLRAGRRWHVPPQGLEYLADEPFRCPVGQADPSTGATYPRQLCGGLGLVGGEHHAEG
ncbi:hypothetical protein D3C84_1030260 [compost metagenome]